MTRNKQRDTLTNESIKKNFTDNFSLALAAIETAKAYIRGGKDLSLGSVLDSVAKSAEDNKEKSKSEV